MITEAYIAGAIKKAIFKKDDQYFLLEKSGNDIYESVPANHINVSDFTFAKPEITHYRNIEWDSDRLTIELNRDAEKHTALNFFLIGMDTMFSEKLRNDVIDLLSKTFFVKKETEIFVRNRVFATKVPKSFDPLSASHIAEKFENKVLIESYRNLSYSNEIIITCRDALKNTILNQKNHSKLNLESLDKEFTDRGVLSDFVLAILKYNYKGVDDSIIKHAPTLNETGIDQPAVFLTELRELVYKSLSVKTEEAKEPIYMDKGTEYENIVAENELEFIDRFNKLIDDFRGKTKRNREHKKGNKTKMIPLVESFKESTVNDQVAWIKDKIKSGNIKNAEKAILKLIEHQDVYSDAEHLCKSLCDIAQSFQEIHLINMSNLFAEKSAYLNPKDPFPHTIIAENFRAKAQLKNALQKYDETIEKFPHNVVAPRGKAETLRQMGKLEEALSLYNHTIEKFPKDTAISQCGKAETLRQMGQLKQALKIYNQCIEKFPDNIVARSGKAETLRQMGKLDDALEIYDQTIENFPHNVVARNGKAETLREMGKLDNALEIYNQTIKKFPKDTVVSQCGKAETLRQMGKLDHALKIYDQSIDKFPDNTVARNGKAETLRQMGKLDDALEIYNQTIEKFSDDVFARNGKAETLRQMGKLDLALNLYDQTIENFPDNVVTRTGKAETLRQMGKLDLALNIYNQTIEKFSNNAVVLNGKAETLRQIGKLDDALKIYSETIEKFSDDVFARTGKAETLRQMGKLDYALRVYDQTINSFPDNVVARNGKAETLRQMGKLEEALLLYNQTIEKSPKDTVISQCGKAETLRQMGKLEEAEIIYSAIIKDYPYDLIARRARFVLLIQQGRNLEELEKQTWVVNPQSIDDWKLHHIHCMLLIKLNKIDEVIIKLKNGVQNIKDIVQLSYYRNALSFAYIKKRNFKDAVAQFTNEGNIRPVFQVLVTHAYAADGNIAESIKKFNMIFKSEIKKIDEVSKYLSDRFHLTNQQFFDGKSEEYLNKKIEELEFDLLMDTYLVAA